jgi:hypothetical protein
VTNTRSLKMLCQKLSLILPGAGDRNVDYW